MASTSSRQRRSYWLKTLHQWHWISAALSLAGLLLFAITGLTLNNAAWIEASPKAITKTAIVPNRLLDELAPLASAKAKSPLPPQTENWLDHSLGTRIAGRIAEFSTDEVYLSLPEAGGDGWLSIDLSDGKVEYEHSNRGWIAYFNDLHKGRYTGAIWSWFIDIFAIACLIFALTGLFLLQLHAKNRPASWPLVILGVLGPFAIMLFFIH